MAYTVDLKNAPKINALADTREDVFDRRYRMYNDNYKDQVKKRLEEIYSNASVLNMDKQIDMTNNVYKTIIGKTSRVYKSGVNREFTDDAMAQLYKDIRINKYMSQANKYVNAYNDILVQVIWDTDKNEPRLTFRYPHKTKVKSDRSEVEYFVEMYKDGIEKWAFWSNSEHYYKLYSPSGDVTIEAIEGNEDMVNPYEVMPFVFMQNGFRDGSFFDMFTGNDLVEITLDVAVYNTFKNYMIKWQSFKQIVIQGTNVGAITGQVLDPSKALTIEGDDTRLDVLDLQANLKELRETIEAQSINVAINYNISPSQFRMTGQVSSGFALQMENFNLDEDTVEQQQDFIEYEREIYDLLVIVGNTEGMSFKEDAEFDVTFPDISYRESQTTTAEVQEKNISLGLDNPISIIQKRDNVDEDRAKEIYAENIKYRNDGNEQFNTPEPSVVLPITEGE